MVRHDSAWLRQPDLDEIATVTAVDSNAAAFPSIDVYEQITNPMTIVLPERDLYAARMRKCGDSSTPDRTES